METSMDIQDSSIPNPSPEVCIDLSSEDMAIDQACQDSCQTTREVHEEGSSQGMAIDEASQGGCETARDHEEGSSQGTGSSPSRRSLPSTRSSPSTSTRSSPSTRSSLRVKPPVEVNEKYRPLFEAAVKGDWKGAEEILDQDSEAITATLLTTASGPATVRDIAVTAGQDQLVENLVKRVPRTNEHSTTNEDSTLRCALCHASRRGGIRKIKELVNEVSDIDANFALSIVIESAPRHKEVIWYLATQAKSFPKFNIVIDLITADHWDILLYLVKKYPKSMTSKQSQSILQISAFMKSFYRSGAQLNFWEKCIYQCIPPSVDTSFDNAKDTKVAQGKITYLMLRVAPFISRIGELKSKHECLVELANIIVKEMKRHEEPPHEENPEPPHEEECHEEPPHEENPEPPHEEVPREENPEPPHEENPELPHEEIPREENPEPPHEEVPREENPEPPPEENPEPPHEEVPREENPEPPHEENPEPPYVFQSTKVIVRDAAFCGIFELVKLCLEQRPELMWDKGFTKQLLELVVRARHVELFRLLNAYNPIRRLMYDLETNCDMMVAVVEWSPGCVPADVSGSAFFMQREIQWFKVLEDASSPILQNLRIKMKKDKNNPSSKILEVDPMEWRAKTYWDEFVEKRKDLLQEAGRWMKDTSSSCSLVATLITTVAFAAAFTVPGSNNNKGIPIFLKKTSFMVFAVADALALFSSVTATLMFLAILTSRYTPKDFLRSLPRKMILGLTFLFLSLASMLVAFGSALMIVLSERWKWIYIPITLLAAVPIILFAILQLPLYVEMVESTYWPRLYRPVKIWK